MGIGITVAICTRDRPVPLAGTLRALSAQRGHVPGGWEVLVVDDGASPLDAGGLGEALAGAAPLRLHRKVPPEGAGLYESRRAAARLAAGALVLFLDDDAEPEPGYLAALAAIASASDAAGFGGVDVHDLPERPSRAAMAYARLFLLRGPGPGDLGATGHNHAQMSWRSQSAPFDSEFLHGCNMAFRAGAIQGLPDLAWLRGHACCEDLVLSTHARTSGRLEVHPSLRVRHRPAEGGRGNPLERLEWRLLNHALFQEWRGPRRRLAGAWALAGLLAKDLSVARGKRGLARGDVARAYARAFGRCVRMPA